MRRWRVEVECGGAPYFWTGVAVNEAAAIRIAAHDIEVKHPNVTAEDIRGTVVVDLGDDLDIARSFAAGLELAP